MLAATVIIMIVASCSALRITLFTFIFIILNWVRAQWLERLAYLLGYVAGDRDPRRLIPGIQCLVGKCHPAKAFLWLWESSQKEKFPWTPGPDSTSSLPRGSWVCVLGRGARGWSRCHGKGVSGAAVLAAPLPTHTRHLGAQDRGWARQTPQKCNLQITIAQCIVFLIQGARSGPGGIICPCSTNLLLAGVSNFFTSSHQSVDSNRLLTLTSSVFLAHGHGFDSKS